MREGVRPHQNSGLGGSDPRLLVILGQPGTAVGRRGLGPGAGATGLGVPGWSRGVMLAPGGWWALAQRGGDTRGALARPVVPPGTSLGPQLQLVDGGHALGFLQAPPGLGDVAGPGSPWGLTPRCRHLHLPPSREGGGLRGGLRVRFGDPVPQPHGAQGLPPTGELLYHLAVAGGLHVSPASLETLLPSAGATGSPWFVRWHPRSLSTPSP